MMGNCEPAYIFKRSENASIAIKQRHGRIVIHKIHTLEGQTLTTILFLKKASKTEKEMITEKKIKSRGQNDLLSLEHCVHKQRMQLLICVVYAQLQFTKLRKANGRTYIL
jgi:hypothetical protein